MLAWYVWIVCGVLLVAVGCTVTSEDSPGTSDRAVAPMAATQPNGSAFRPVAVRYQVADVERAVAFYTRHLGFRLEQQAGPAFARVANGNLILWLSGPKSSGSRPMPDGRRQEAGGWNRIALEVTDLPSRVEALKAAGVRFRNDIETGPGGRQIQVEDPDGNPVELFEPAP